MRVVQVHTRYRELGGEDSAAEAEARVLERGGHSVRRVLFDNRTLLDTRSTSGSLRAATRAIWSASAGRRLAAALEEVKPDVVHFHNTFPSASPSVIQTASRMGYPVVATLHNYRLGCLNAQLYRDGAPCLDCVGRLPWPGVLHNCYRQSKAGSLVVAGSLIAHRALRTWQDHVDLFLTPSSFAAGLLARIGVPSDRIVVKPNAVGWEVDRTQGSQEYFVFVGRMVEYKGIADVAACWVAADLQPTLKVVGDGPLLPELQDRFRGGRIEFLGSLLREDLSPILHEARALLFASRGYELLGMTILEAMASALPVIAPSGGAAEELVVDGVTGLLYEPGNWDQFAAHVRLLASDREHSLRMGLAAAERYESEFSSGPVLDATLRAYAEAIRRRRSRGGSR